MMSVSGSGTTHGQPTSWREIEVITGQFMRCPAFKPTSSAGGVGRWSLPPFHYHVYNMKLFRWLHCGQHPGKDRIAQLHTALCPAMDCRHWSPKRENKKQGTDVTDHGTASTEQALIHMVTTRPAPVRLQAPAQATSAATPQGTAVDALNTMETDHGSTTRPSEAALAEPRPSSSSSVSRPAEPRPSTSSSVSGGQSHHQCEVCLHWTTHIKTDCPLVLSASGATKATVRAKLKDLPCVKLLGAELHQVPGDGNCLFTSYAIAVASGSIPSTREGMQTWGRQARMGFLRKVEKLLQRRESPQCFDDIPLHNLLLDVDKAPDDRPRRLPASDWPETREYLERMREWGTRASWGGAAELRVLAGMSQRRIFLVEKHGDDTWQLFLPPLGSGGRAPDICVAWSGGHYDAVRLPPEGWRLLYPSAGA